jgi:hypothetical protein
MPNKYLSMSGGRVTEVEATASSAGAGDAGELVALDAAGKIDSTMMPTGVGADAADIAAGENLSAGDFVNVYDDSGVKVRKADASTAGKEADGFVLSAYTSGQTATVYFEGSNTGVSGKTIGARQYLSAATAGACTETPPSGSANVVQYLGRARLATAVTFEPDEGVILA